jgi:hypothetical protein
MTDSEVHEFWTEAFVRFPGVAQWINEHSPRPDLTRKLWSEALVSVKASEAMSVLTRWSNGSLPAPTGYQKEVFHLHVLAVIDEDRRVRRTLEWERKKQHEQGPKRTEIIRPSELIPVMGPYMQDVAALARSTRDPSEIDRLIDECYERACVCIDKKTEYQRKYAN